MRQFHNLHQRLVEIGAAITADNYLAGTVNGNAIALPWKKGGEIVFLASAQHAAGATIAFHVEAQQRSDNAWVKIKSPTTKAAMVSLSGARYDDNGQLDGGAVMMTLPLDRLGADDPSGDFHGTYDNLRLVAVVGTAAVDLSVTYVIVADEQRPKSDPTLVDDLFDLLIAGTGS